MANELFKRVKQTEFDNARQEAMVSLLVAAGHYRQILNDICADYGITYDQYNILRILKGVHPDGHRRYEISDRMIERAPDVTRLLDRLVKRGLAERSCSTEDRRCTIARITDKGLKLLGEMDPDFSKASQHFTRSIPEAELKQFSGTCNKFFANLDES